MEQIRIKCPNLVCRKILAVPSSSRGKNVRCKNCGATIRVPDRSAAPTPLPGRKREDQDDAAADAA